MSAVGRLCSRAGAAAYRVATLAAGRLCSRAGAAAYRVATLADFRWRTWGVNCAARPQESLSSERGQSTVEYALIISLISVPLALLILRLLQALFQALIQRIVSDFSEGPS